MFQDTKKVGRDSAMKKAMRVRRDRIWERAQCGFLCLSFGRIFVKSFPQRRYWQMIGGGGTTFFQVVLTQRSGFSHTHMAKSNNPCGSYSHSEVGYRNPGQKEAEGWGEVCVARVFFFFKFKGCVFRERRGGRRMSGRIVSV